MPKSNGTIYLSVKDDVLDHIAWKHYGQTTPEILQMLWDKNPSLSAHPVVLPEGIVIFLPDMPPTPKKEAMRLW